MIQCAGIDVCRATEALKLSSLSAVRRVVGLAGEVMRCVRCKLRSIDLQALARVGNQHLCRHVGACLEEWDGRPVSDRCAGSPESNQRQRDETGNSPRCLGVPRSRCLARPWGMCLCKCVCCRLQRSLRLLGRKDECPLDPVGKRVRNPRFYFPRPKRCFGRRRTRRAAHTALQARLSGRKQLGQLRRMGAPNDPTTHPGPDCTVCALLAPPARFGGVGVALLIPLCQNSSTTAVR
jgi:hypothetical protein